MLKNRKILISALVLLGVLVVGLAIILVRSFFQKNIVISNQDKTSQSTESSSTFGKFVNESPEDTLRKLQAGSSTQTQLEVSMDQAFRFLGINRAVQLKDSGLGDYDQKILLENMEVLIEMVDTEKGNSYVLLASNNPQYDYKVGTEVTFTPTIDPKNLIIQGADKSLSYSTELLGYVLPSSLQHGDKIVFTCVDNNCISNNLSWALVFRSF